ncbi:hypothetical protein CUV01_18145 [Paracoccus tegillarcae]|uniref:Oxidoreductase molybdopterin-binding domain-containing protein n=2 Tax=Paracoccus tegillarcae TaxID=1529068 RepID=A0A2K9F3T1_9RHOB|nr:hypothetical protein CUV01_18145 [Paracoccus tegillarcae]
MSVAMILPAAVLAQDQTGAVIEMTGPDISVELSADSLAAMTITEQDVRRETDDGPQDMQFRGVLLWDLLVQETTLDDDVKQSLRNTVQVIASDGHEVAFSVGEIAPGFGNAPILLAFEKDGQPLGDGLQMVVQGDSRGARFIKGIVKIEIK